MKILMVGACGYGAYLLDLIDKYVDGSTHSLSGVADPCIEASPWAGRLRERGVPLYTDMAAYYNDVRSGKTPRADLAVISSPIQFHKEQSILALRNGTSVLCEKPVTPTAEEAMFIQKAVEDTGLHCGVGFQWSFSHTMMELKRDILAGKYGRPLRLRTLVAWRREDAYYDTSSWKGRVRDREGSLVMDSVAMNATSHYLHNMLFILGDGMDKAALPRKIGGCLYRVRDIESYDTVFLRGEFPGGAEMLCTVSHAAQKIVNPVFTYEFEKGTVTFGDDTSGEVRGTFTDGTVKNYGCPQTDESCAQKILSMLETVRSGEPPVCNVLTVLPHLRVCGGMYDNMPISNFPDRHIIIEDNPPGRFVTGLNEAMDAFYSAGTFPDRRIYPWASTPVDVMF